MEEHSNCDKDAQDPWNDEGPPRTIHEAARRAASDPEMLSHLRRFLEEGVDPNLRDNLYEGWPPLFYAVQGSESVEAAQILITAGADIHLKDFRYGGTALHRAALGSYRRNNIKAIELLLSLGANPNEPDNEGVTPVMVAAKAKNSFEAVCLLVEAEGDVHLRDKHGNTLLHHCVYHGSDDVRTLNFLLNSGVEPDVRNDDGETPFITLASRAGSVEGLSLLLERGVDINAQTKSGDTALHRAIWWVSGPSKIEKTDFLLKRGADPNVVNQAGESPLYLAYSVGDSEARRLLLEHDAALECASPIHLAIIAGDLDKVKVLIKSGSNINACDGTNRPPLHLAINLANDEMVELLLENGADPLARLDPNRDPALKVAIRRGVLRIVRILCDRLGEFRWDYSFMDTVGSTWGYISPLHEAVESKSCEIAEYFIEKGVDVNEKYNHGSSPLWMAVMWGGHEMVRLLLKHGARTDDTDLLGRSLLHMAAIDGNEETVRILLGVGLEPNCRTIDGYTPLHLAVCTEKLTVVEVLLKSRVYVNLANKEGYTPLHYGVYTGNTALVEALLEGGASPELEDKNGFTPLMVAQSQGRKDIIAILKRYE